MHYNPYLYVALLLIEIVSKIEKVQDVYDEITLAKPSVYEFLGRDTSHGSFTHLH
jgi:hypothetical protein